MRRSLVTLLLVGLACVPHGPRAPEGPCPPPDGAPLIYAGAEPLPSDAPAVRRFLVRARFEDVLEFYRACYGAREYPFTSRRRASFRLGEAEPSAASAPGQADLRSEFMVIERRPQGVELRFECHGCDGLNGQLREP